MRRLLGIFIGIALAGPVAAQSAPEYILHIIPPFGGGMNEAYAHDVNSDGTVVGRSGGTINSGFVWTPSGGASIVTGDAVAVAEDGTYVAGTEIRLADGSLFANLPPVDGVFTAIRPGAVLSGPGILDAPVVVGRAFDPTVSPGPSSCTQCIAPLANIAFVYDPVNGARNLDTLGVTDSFFARDLNAAGRIVGDTNDTGTDASTRAFVFDLATAIALDLGTLRPDDVGIASARGVNTAGDVVGYAMSPSLGDEHAFLWTESSGMIDIGTLGSSSGIFLDRSRAYAINASGVVVGESTSPDAVSPIAIRHPFVWDAVNGMRDLNDLVALPASYELVRATAISDSGWICGYGVGAAGNGFTSAFALEPISPPGTPFIRGDCNESGGIEIADAIGILGRLFQGQPIGPCPASCDVDGDDSMGIADAIVLLSYLFIGGPPPADPFPDCGVSSAADCDTFSACP